LGFGPPHRRGGRPSRSRYGVRYPFGRAPLGSRLRSFEGLSGEDGRAVYSETRVAAGPLTFGHGRYRRAQPGRQDLPPGAVAPPTKLGGAPSARRGWTLRPSGGRYPRTSCHSIPTALFVGVAVLWLDREVRNTDWKSCTVTGCSTDYVSQGGVHCHPRRCRTAEFTTAAGEERRGGSSHPYRSRKLPRHPVWPMRQPQYCMPSSEKKGIPVMGSPSRVSLHRVPKGQNSDSRPR
jgi:hypothetical protein